MAYIGKNPRLKSIVSQGDTLANLTAEPRVAGRLVWATDEMKFYYDDGTDLNVVGSGAGGGGNVFNSGPVEVFNNDIIVSANATSLTGLAYFRAPGNFKVVKVQVEIFEKGAVASGILSIDVKKGNDADDLSMATIMTTQPEIDFATALDYDFNAGVIDPLLEDVNDNQVLRLDITSKPAGLTKFRVSVIGGGI